MIKDINKGKSERFRRFLRVIECMTMLEQIRKSFEQNVYQVNDSQ